MASINERGPNNENYRRYAELLQRWGVQIHDLNDEINWIEEEKIPELKRENEAKDELTLLRWRFKTLTGKDPQEED